MNKTSRDIIIEHAREYGWKRLISRYPLQDQFVKGMKTLTMKYAITGRVVSGSLRNIIGEDDFVNNRNKAMDVIEGK